jgi:hypothetical protein
MKFCIVWFQRYRSAISVPVGLDLMAALFAPYSQPDLARSGVAEPRPLKEKDTPVAVFGCRL